MLIDRSAVRSISYWCDQHEPERFYISFCLFFSAIQDWALGQRELRCQNLNWSATCSYYSLVHAGRVITFLALGDFPKSHFNLRALFSATHEARSDFVRPGADGYPFNWLRGFRGGAAGRGRAQSADPPRWPLVELRRMIVQYLLRVGVSSADERLRRFGYLFSTAAPLRSDSNYEALLIAHEYRHVSMSSAFEDLARCMNSAAESQMSFLVETFSAFLQSDPDLGTERLAYSSFLRNYLTERLIPGVDKKLEVHPDVQQRIREILDPLSRIETGASYRHLEEAVSLKMFGRKARLMNRFQDGIDELCREVQRHIA
jgi:hypothetical protein